jgi:hypothetical protein
MGGAIPPTRGPQVTLDPVGTVIAAPQLPARPRATPNTRRDIIAARDHVERLKRRMEEVLWAVNDAASDLGLDEDPLLVHARKRLRTWANWPADRCPARAGDDDEWQGIEDNDQQEDGDGKSDDEEEPENQRKRGRY